MTEHYATINWERGGHAFTDGKYNRVHVWHFDGGADCLETLEEIAMENRDFFLAAGGEQYAYISCLNDSIAHIEMIRSLVVDNINGWSK